MAMHSIKFRFVSKIGIVSDQKYMFGSLSLNVKLFFEPNGSSMVEYSPSILEIPSRVIP